MLTHISQSKCKWQAFFTFIIFLLSFYFKLFKVMGSICQAKSEKSSDQQLIRFKEAVMLQ